MTKKPARGIDAQLAALRELDATSPAAIELLRTSLASSHAAIVTAAAALIGEHAIAKLAADLVDAFVAWAPADAKKDAMCRARSALARALVALDHWDERVFPVGLRITQREGYDPEDTAAGLRGLCGLAYARMLRPDAIDAIATLLADAHRTARLAGAQAAGDLGRIDAAGLLRFKLLAAPHDEPDVLAACFESLLHLDRGGGIDFAAHFLDGTASPSFAASRDPAHARIADGHANLAELAAIAIGGTRDPKGLPALVRYSENARPAVRHRVAYLALALLRHDDANAVLLAAISDGAKADALAACRALATFAPDPAVAALLAKAIAARTSAVERRELTALLS